MAKISLYCLRVGYRDSTSQEKVWVNFPFFRLGQPCLSPLPRHEAREGKNCNSWSSWTNVSIGIVFRMKLAQFEGRRKATAVAERRQSAGGANLTALLDIQRYEEGGGRESKGAPISFSPARKGRGLETILTFKQDAQSLGTMKNLSPSIPRVFGQIHGDRLHGDRLSIEIRNSWGRNSWGQVIY